MARSAIEQNLEYGSEIEANFAIISKEAWATVLLQIVKTYVLPIANVRHFRALPGVGKDEPEFDWWLGKTNIYGTSENLLLKWVSYHFWKRTGVRRNIKCFGEDMSDCVAFAHLLMSHIPSLSETHFHTFNYQPSTYEQVQLNAKLIISAFEIIFGSQFLSSNTSVNAVRLSEGNEINNLILVVFLYQTLPHCLPSASIDFVGGLHEKITQTIELSNPSNRTLVYFSEPFGQPEFTFPQSQIMLTPKSSTSAQIVFESRFSRPISTLLQLKTKKIGLNNSSILVFSLNGRVDSVVPIKTIRTECALYCLPPNILNVNVRNPFIKPASFAIQLHQKKVHHTIELDQILNSFCNLPFDLLEIVERKYGIYYEGIFSDISVYLKCVYDSLLLLE